MIIRFYNIEWNISFEQKIINPPKEVVIQLNDNFEDVTLLKGYPTKNFIYKCNVHSDDTKRLKEVPFNPLCLPSILYGIFTCKVDGFEYELVD
jgi:hypothetical protein